MNQSSRPWVRAFAPASVSNLTCGFDLLGYAIEGRGDTVAARACDEPGVRIRQITGDGGRLPVDPSLNTAGVAALELLRRRAAAAGSRGVELHLHKGLPLASGLGSSAASGVAGAVAVNEALGLGADRSLLLAAALEAERVACGTPHADNAAPSLVGGLVLVRPGESPAITPLRVPKGLTCVLLHPHAEVSTGAARAALPATVSLETLTAQSGNLAALVVGLLTEDHALIASAMVDLVAEPARAAMTPGFHSVRRAALAAGALGCGLSGSGPTLFAWSSDKAGATRIETAMRGALAGETGLECDSWLSPVGAPGARLLSPQPDGETA